MTMPCVQHVTAVTWETVDLDKLEKARGDAVDKLDAAARARVETDQRLHH